MDWITITVLILAGLVLLALEVYVPGFVLGSIGVVLMIVAAVLCFKTYGANATMLVVAIEVVFGIGVVVAALRWFPQTAAGRKMILASTQTGQRAHAGHGRELIGQEGVAQSILRPTGVALVQGKRLDVVAESGMIERGSPVRVVAVEENRIIVRKV